MELRKGFYFSLDAMLAAGLIFMGFFAVMNMDLSQSTPQFARNYQEANTVAEDSMQLMAGSTFAQAFTKQERERLINTSALDDGDLNRSVMNVIAILWASNRTASARNLTRAYLDRSVPPGMDYRLKLANEDEELLYSSDDDFDNASLVARSTRLVTGVSRNRPTSGYLAKASLTSLGAVEPHYFYFGGYVGDGNITVNMSLPDYRNIVYAEIEADVADAFDLSINGDAAGSYEPSGGNLSADRWTICNQTANTTRCGSFQEGNNKIRFDLPSNRSSIGGGFIKVGVNDSQSITAKSATYQQKRDRLPGINGVINIFSSFTVPGTLHGMQVKVHYEAESDIFMEIGNSTLFINHTEDGDETLSFNNTTVFEALNGTGMSYRSMSNTTVPFRLGIRNVTELIGDPEDVDAIAVTDLSASMSAQTDCPPGTSKCKLKEAKNATKNFTRFILNTTNSRVGLSGFAKFVRYPEHLQTTEEPLINEIESWDTDANNCVGCGVVNALNLMIQRPLRQTVLPRRSTWRYHVGMPSGNWTEPGYNDSDWNSSTAPLGDGGSAVSQIGAADRYVFRTSFTYDKFTLHELFLSLRQSGASSVYLNGEQIYSAVRNYSGAYWDTQVGRWTERENMWHLTSHRAATGNTSWYFGQEEAYHYATGELENGSLTSQAMDLTNISSPQLTFSHRLDLEQSEGDTAYVEINNGTGWETVTSYTSSTTGWSSESLDVGTYNGTEVRVRFRFVPGSAKGRKAWEYEGWYVDDVRFAGFRSDAIDTSLINNGKNTIAVAMNASSQPFTNTTEDVDLTTGSFTNTTSTADGVELDAATEGTYVSAPVDAGRVASLEAASVERQEPAGTNLSILYGTNSSGSWTYNESIDATGNGRYVRVKAVFEANSTARTPTLANVSLNLSSYGITFDLALVADALRNRAMVVLSDGDSNKATAMDNVTDHNGDGSVGPSDHTIEAGCRAHEKHNITVYTVGYGKDAEFEELNETAQCGGGEIYNASIGELEEIYREIGKQIIRATFEAQRIDVLEGNVNQTLYPDSYIQMNYSSPSSLEFGKFSITQDSGRFGGNVSSPKNGSFEVPNQTEILDAELLSYSSRYWTDRVTVENRSGMHEYVFKLWRYGEEYRRIGDPYQLFIPPTSLQTGTQNNVSVDTALNRTDPVGGSPDARVVYDLQVSGLVGYGEVFNKSEGGTRNVSSDYGNFTLEVGQANDTWDPNQDALDNATERLLAKLDVDDDGRIDFQLDADNLDINENSLSGLRWLWGPARVTLEVWEDA